jgi:hypothetical protein
MPRERNRKSSVKLAADFRDNLIIDRYDPQFVPMRASKLEYMRSENSEDAITWNVFRTFRQIDPRLWYPSLFRKSFPDSDPGNPRFVTVELWFRERPPATLQHREGPSEIDVMIKTPSDVWFIEAKYKSDISRRTKYAPNRNQIIRNIDVGSSGAGIRDFWFSLLILGGTGASLGEQTLLDYKANRERIFNELTHRSDRLKNLREIGRLTWRDTADVLEQCVEYSTLAAEKQFAGRALTWLQQKGISHIRSG